MGHTPSTKLRDVARPANPCRRRYTDLDGSALSRELLDAKETIRILEERIDIILGSIHAGIVIIDAESHTITEVNPEASRLIGVPRDQITGKICHTYICPAQVGACPITDKGQKVDNSERILLTSSGESLPILKTVASVELNGRQHLLESFLDISQMKELQKELEYLATTDSLTGAYNRRYFIELSEREINRARRSDAPLSLAMIDIDYFKRINDTHGHMVGDMVLKELVAICKVGLRPYDLVGRLGGEEFALALLECDIRNALEVVERLRRNVERSVIVQDGKEVTFRISAGVAQLHGETETWESVISRADQALYHAKNAGRNLVHAAP